MQEKSKCIAPETLRHWLDGMMDTKTLEQICEPFQPVRGAPALLLLPDLIRVGVYHELAPCGARSTHAADVTGLSISDSAISQRLQTLDPRVFQTVLDRTLKPMAQRRHHPQAFYKHWRLVGIDGAQFSIPNGLGVSVVLPKARSRRGRAAFSKLGINSLCELGVHNPIAAVIGQNGESEMALARELFERLPADALLLGDRYYGTGCCVSALMPLCQQRHAQFLLRVRANLKRRVVKTFSDGSALVEVAGADGGALTLREIEGRVRGRSGAMIPVRLWTSLVDARAHPSLRLLKLYRERWEQEMAIGELKQTLHGGVLLHSQKARTAWHEVAALLVAQAVVARMRVQVGRDAGVDVLRVSFQKTLESARVLCVVLAEAADIVSAAQMRKLSERLLDRVARQLSGRRRARSCPRAVRQPVSAWPRKQKASNSYGEFKYEVAIINQ
jgi:hypothetical protein